ncbi:CLIP-associating protein 1-A-like isoform X6 [Mytilus edulis]|uniref:CLIP-associating protein 1-A-like isoform X6 n=1 Tax=Mytilus edulis TaxID=6550 RepID=UPI0039F0497B
MATLDDFTLGITTSDTRKRVQTHSDLVSHLRDPYSSIHCIDIDELIGGLVAWVNCSNYKISINGLEVLCLMVDRMGEDFKPHISSVMVAVVDRLGDSKDQVRDQAQQLLLKLMMPGSSPQFVFERLMGAFNHKLWHVREGVLICLQNTLNLYGARCLSLNKIVPSICKLIEDQNSQVRDEAVNTLCEIYRHVGEKVRQDMAKKGIPAPKLTQIYQRFDEVKASGNMLATADFAPSRAGGDDDTDFARPTSTKVLTAKRVQPSSSTTSKRSGVPSKSSSGSSLQRRRSISGPVSSAASTGAVDEDFFTRSFEDVPKVQIFSARDMTDVLNKAKDILSDEKKDWEKRNEAIKTVRSVIVQGGQQQDEFFQLLRGMEPCFTICIRDLRSQIVREACITIAYMSQQLGSKFDHFAESQMSHLINLIPNSAKIMATSGIVCIRFILQYTHSHRLLPIITSVLTSKSATIRRQVCEFINQILHTWPTHVLEKQIANLQDALKRGINDADTDARAFSRKAFWGFADHFKDQADALLNALEPSKQKQVRGELSGSSSNNSLNSAEGLTSRPRSASTDRGFDSSTLGRIGKRKNKFSSASSDTGGADLDVEGDAHKQDLDKPLYDLYGRRIGRSNSAADITNPYATAPRNRRNQTSGRTTPVSFSGRMTPTSQISGRMTPTSSISGRMTPTSSVTGRTTPVHFSHNSGSSYNSTYNSLPRQKSSTSHSSTSRRPRTSGASQSQPNSRSNSPNSRLGYVSHTRKDRTPAKPRRSGVVRSQGASREGSPNRYGHSGRERRLSGSKIPSSGGKTKVQAHRVLRPGSDVEDALAEALIRGGRSRYDTYDSDDAASENSSVCSERSFASLGKTSEHKDMDSSSSSPPTLKSDEIKDTAEIISLLGSTSTADRKEGLIALQNLLRLNRYLTRVELRKVMEIFTRMFHDPASKVLSLFFDTLVDLVIVHNRDLHDHLYLVLTKLIVKTGADMLGSQQAKVQKCLDTIRDNFPYNMQFNVVTKFIIDQTQSHSLKEIDPPTKVKSSLLNFLHSLVQVMDVSDLMNSADSRLAISRIINWTTEPKSVDVRKGAQMVLIALFNLNPPEFSMMLSYLPKAFQDGATKILHNHIRSASHESDVLSPRNVTSPPQNRSRPPSRTEHHDELETENMNPEDIYNSIKKTSADIQNLSINSKLDSYENVKKKIDFTSQDSGIQDLRNDSPDAVDGRKTHYNPSHYQDEGILNGLNRSRLADPDFDEGESFNEEPWKALLGISQYEDDFSENDIISEILKELSNHNERNEEREEAMKQLIKLTREGSFGLWDEHFKTILLILLETLGDNDVQIRALALKCLREILRHQPRRFCDYAELTTLRILEAHKDPDWRVQKAADECAETLANYIPPDQCIRILTPIVQSASHPINLGAIKMQTKAVERMPNDALEGKLTDIIPGLVKAYDDQVSTVRKSAVFCLVAIHTKVGDTIWNYLTKLNYSKVKLLNLYIKRNQQKETEKKVGGI